MNKKGINPLIATFILMAVAVFIGVLILNITSKTPTTCELSLDVERDMCIQNNKLMMRINNKGPKISGFVVNSVSENYDSFSLFIDGIDKNSKKNIEISIPFTEYVELIPLISDTNICYNYKFQKSKIPKC